MKQFSKKLDKIEEDEEEEPIMGVNSGQLKQSMNSNEKIRSNYASVNDPSVLNV